jgi:hypothetical protein
MAPRGAMVYPKLNAADTKFDAGGAFGSKVRYDLDRADVQAFIAKLTPMHEQAVERAGEMFKQMPVKARKTLEAKSITKPVVNPLYGEVYDEATEEPTGQIEFNFKCPASAKAKNGKNAGKVYIRRPTVVDAKGKVLIKGTDFSWLHEIKPGPATLANTVFKKMGPAIWGGSEGKFSLEIGTFDDGLPGYFMPGTGACGLSLRLRGVQLLSLSQGGSDELGFGAEEGYEGDEYADDAEQNDSAESGEGEANDEADDANADDKPDF